MEREPTISLKEQKDTLHIASGAFAHCYRHPDDPQLCIKIPTSSSKAGKRLRTDVSYYHKLHALKKDLSQVSDMLGPCLTDLGPGHLYQCITDHDGSVSKTLGHHIKEHPEKLSEIITALQELAQYLLTNRIMISDIHVRNILLRVNPEKAPLAIIVDGIGDKVAITLLNHIGSLADAKIARRWNRFITYLQNKFPEIDFPEDQLFLDPGKKK